MSRQNSMRQFLAYILGTMRARDLVALSARTLGISEAEREDARQRVRTYFDGTGWRAKLYHEFLGKPLAEERLENGISSLVPGGSRRLVYVLPLWPQFHFTTT